ncbi:MAG: acyl-ACP thioesterase [Pseudomonadales bacterium]|nr:acyl-ACP thioesterase [Pseudomonadales bacterium]
MQACFYGSVNRWECDENDHLNVRFFAHKMNQALQVFLHGHGWEIASDMTHLGQVIRAQHIRFLKEARIATPLRVDCGLVGGAAEDLHVLCLMKNNADESVLAAFTTEVHVGAWFGRPDLECSPVTDATGPRGIDPLDLFPRPGSLDQARAAGFRSMGRGVIEDVECDSSGLLLPHVYIGRISDGMPNLWALTSTIEGADSRRTGEMGGAALEYRLNILDPLRQGEIFHHVSGIRSLGGKTQHMVHMLFSESRGRLSASAEAIGVVMDLTTRKAMPISEQRRERLTPMLLRRAGPAADTEG